MYDKGQYHTSKHANTSVSADPNLVGRFLLSVGRLDVESITSEFKPFDLVETSSKSEYILPDILIFRYSADRGRASQQSRPPWHDRAAGETPPSPGHPRGVVCCGRRTARRNLDPAGDRAPGQIYTPERKAEFLLNNAVGAKDYRHARAEVKRMGLDPDRIRHHRPPKRG